MVKVNNDNDATRNSFDCMQCRCNRETSDAYPRYGAKGVTICEEWDRQCQEKRGEAFRRFKDAVGLRPSGCTLDRIDPGGNYEPGNVQWSTPKEQSNNRKDNRIIEAFGEKKTIRSWMDDPRCKCSCYSTFHTRLQAGKMLPEEIITTP